MEVQSALRAKELHKGSNQVQDQVPESLNIKKFKGKKNFKKDRDVSKGAPKDQKETRSCHWCKKPGHLKCDCYAWKKKQAEEAGQNKHSSDCVQENETPEILNVMEEVEAVSWILDSGCSFHMCPNIHWFESLVETSGSVVLGNNQICNIMGVGKVRLRLSDNSVKILSDVRYIPEVKRKLISLGLLEKKGCSFGSSGGKMIIRKGDNVIMQGERRGSLYYLDASVIKNDNLEANSIKAETIRLWHMRLGHPADGSIKQLIKKEVIYGVEDGNDQSCEECILAKAKKLPYPKGKHTSQAPLEYAHSDLWGPAPVNSVGGGRYYITIIDDFSRKTWLYVLKEKSEAFTKFRDWCKIVEMEKGCVVKCLRTDNGLEFLSKEFEGFYQDRGIKRHRTVPLNPQQNDVAERANRTILERVRSMLFASEWKRDSGQRLLPLL